MYFLGFCFYFQENDRSSKRKHADGDEYQRFDNGVEKISALQIQVFFLFCELRLKSDDHTIVAR